MSEDTFAVFSDPICSSSHLLLLPAANHVLSQDARLDCCGVAPSSPGGGRSAQVFSEKLPRFRADRRVMS